MSVTDLDLITSLIANTNFDELEEVDPKVSKELVDFIILVSDFGEQITHKELIDLWENSSVSKFWEFMCATYLWSIPAQELADRQRRLLAGYDGELCRRSLDRMLNLFNDHLRIG